MWEIENTTYPVARKEYHCQAWDWIDNAGYDEGDYEPEDWETIEKARTEGFKILPGTKYVCTHGKWEGEFTTFRARNDLHHICLDYDLYPDA